MRSSRPVMPRSWGGDSAGPATAGMRAWWRTRSGASRSSSTRPRAQRRSPWRAVTLTLPKERPAWNVSTSSSRSGCIVAARAKIMCADFAVFSGCDLHAATIAWPRIWLPSTTSRPSPSSERARKRPSATGFTSNASSKSRRSFMPARPLSAHDRDVLEAAHVRLVGAGEPALVHLPVGEARLELLDRDLRLDARERLPDADVLAVAEVELALGLARDVEAVGRVELARVPTGGPGDERHARLLRDRDAVHRHLAQRDAPLELARRVVAQHLFDRV